MKKHLLILLLLVVSSCSTQQKILYFQDNVVNEPIEVQQGGDITLRPSDVLSISVSSQTPELAAIFNKERSRQGGSSSSDELLFTIDSKGNIDLPILGTINVEGMTREELTKDIQKRILDGGMIKDPVVTIEFSNLTFSTLGEVGSPGSYSITKDQTTILEALSMSGDLTIYGLRDRVFVTRSLADKVVTYQLDLRSRDIFKSPAYYVQQNDVIYVEPNKVRSNQSTVNGNTVRSTSFWMSLVSFVTSLSLIFVNL